ncbi:hypothetical protein NQ318_017303 [Aromia moschata]|uniref:Mnd1 HTH domain-containing protein n=1 Tax=Aromia moschata TaxID=1265417 RepID=A0AAV8XX73_9CUCU|nr:hypothetical protein NQ318_017303 [Aromia moschata]
MSRKGVSAEEKKSRMVQLFYERGECFQLKFHLRNWKKLRPKEKGIVANSVKDVVQKLVEDGVVDTDKISGSIYFWAFPRLIVLHFSCSKGFTTRKRKLVELENKLDESCKKLKLMEKSAEGSKENREDKDKRNRILDEINDLELALHESKKKLKHSQDTTRKDTSLSYKKLRY